MNHRSFYLRSSSCADVSPGLLLRAIFFNASPTSHIASPHHLALHRIASSHRIIPATWCSFSSCFPLIKVSYFWFLNLLILVRFNIVFKDLEFIFHTSFLKLKPLSLFHLLQSCFSVSHIAWKLHNFIQMILTNWEKDCLDFNCEFCLFSTSLIPEFYLKFVHIFLQAYFILC